MNDELNQTDIPGDDLAMVREVVLHAYPDCVPELVRGDSVAEMLASIEPARAAYTRVATLVAQRTEPPIATVPPVVPAGGGSAVVDPAHLPAAEKVRRGIAQQR